jgi:hypothetical protein
MTYPDEVDSFIFVKLFERSAGNRSGSSKNFPDFLSQGNFVANYFTVRFVIRPLFAFNFQFRMLETSQNWLLTYVLTYDIFVPPLPTHTSPKLLFSRCGHELPVLQRWFTSNFKPERSFIQKALFCLFSLTVWFLNNIVPRLQLVRPWPSLGKLVSWTLHRPTGLQKSGYRFEIKLKNLACPENQLKTWFLLCLIYNLTVRTSTRLKFRVNGNFEFLKRCACGLDAPVLP